MCVSAGHWGVCEISLYTCRGTKKTSKMWMEEKRCQKSTKTKCQGKHEKMFKEIERKKDVSGQTKKKNVGGGTEKKVGHKKRC